jgi:hypothetical protein
MLGSTLLDVAIGLVFVYLLVSLVCSAANEVIEGWLKNRSTDLEKGIRELFASNSKIGDTPLVKELYNHPLIQGLYKGKYDEFVAYKSKNTILRFITRFWKGTNLPSYIPARSFALALMDTVLPASATASAATSPPTSPLTSPPAGPVASGATGATPAQAAPNVRFTVPAVPAPPPSPLDPANPLYALRNAIGAKSVGPDALLTPQAKQSLLTFIDAAGADVGKARESIEGWFNSSMDRVSGWYKRRTQVFILTLGLVISVAFNIDSILIAKRLSTDRSLRESVVAAAEEYAKKSAESTSTSTPQKPCEDPNSAECKFEKSKQDLQALGLPIGWDKTNDTAIVPGTLKDAWPQWLQKVLGWVITALAVSLGAPFWFDMLNKFIVIRSTVKPHEKSPEEPSKQ